MKIIITISFLILTGLKPVLASTTVQKALNIVQSSLDKNCINIRFERDVENCISDTAFQLGEWYSKEFNKGVEGLKNDIGASLYKNELTIKGNTKENFKKNHDIEDEKKRLLVQTKRDRELAEHRHKVEISSHSLECIIIRIKSKFNSSLLDDLNTEYMLKSRNCVE